MEILGLLDALESLVLDSFKFPLTSKVVVDEQKILDVVEKIRLVVQKGDGVVRQAISRQPELLPEKSIPVMKIAPPNGGESDPQTVAVETMKQAYQVAREVRAGADRYADEVLANLEATSTRILRTIQNGRLRISKFTGQEMLEARAPEVAGPAS